MNINNTRPPVRSTLLEQPMELSLDAVSRTCAVQATFIIELIEEGVLAPITGHEPDSWRFSSSQLRLITVASRLQRDLGINLAGAALVLQLLDEIETLRAHINATTPADDDQD